MQSGGAQNEGDQIILSALRQIECVSIGPDVLSVGQLTPDMIVEAVSRSLFLISGGEAKFPTTLPANIATKHKVCTQMATKVKELGFPQLLGYNQLLYPTEAQTKELIFWLVQKLPRQEEDTAAEAMGSHALLNRRITAALDSWVKSTWKLHFCTSGMPPKNIYNLRPLRTVTDEAAARGDLRKVFERAYAGTFAPESTLYEQHTHELLADQRYAMRLENDISQRDLDSKSASLEAIIKNSFGNALNGAGSSGVGLDAMGIGDASSKASLNDMLAELLAESNAHRDAGKGTRFSHAAEFGQEEAGDVGMNGSSSNGSGMGLGSRLAGAHADLDAEDAAARKERLEREDADREADLEALRQNVEKITQQLEVLGRTQGNGSARIRQLESELEGLLAKGELLESDILLKRKTLEMLPNAAANIAKLQEICGASGARLLQLAQEWERHRKPLVDQVREITNAGSDRRDKCRKMMDEMRVCKEEMAGMIHSLKDKQDRARLLAEELEQLPKNINRALYTQRIMDIIASISKQNVEIERITADIRNIQKSINHTSQTLARSDHATEELIYAAANAPNSDVATVETYRALTTLRAEFDTLLTVASNIGAQDKQSRDLEVKIEQELTRVSGNNVERLRADLKAVLAENAALVQKLKAM
jgi:hypothetical protein